MLLRPLLRRGAAAAANAAAGSGGVLPTARPEPPASLASLLLASRSYAKAKGGGKPAGSTSNRGKVRAKDPRGVASAEDAAGEFAGGGGVEDDGIDDEFELPTDPLPPTYDPALDVGPGGRPLFAFTDTFGTFHHRDANVYVDFTLDEWNAILPEGLPAGMMKEFQETRRCADGWLVFYVPQGKDWTHGGFFYRNTYSDFFDTPVQAAKIMQDFVKYNETRLQQLPCQIFEPIPLGEGAGVGMMKGADTVEMPEGSTLYDLIQTGITNSHASVGVLVHLRKELSLVKHVPVLFAIDQYNSWFTFSDFQEPVTVRSCRPIHAKELTTVGCIKLLTSS
ncbi:hypothetical protein PR202_gb12620 [Eleusine coracana subsp. coracana]|uniref:Small ribosomal subunit protein mS29 n=1 Tax=Eleusine coracana subsp. coracana TaxID=191504 RepID=A0AAV5EQX3_ELECO|nr:hypothetical protein PR202_gb12620 [Eleusine coracana subsp. coracana]